jgi:hypothetical protein
MHPSGLKIAIINALGYPEDGFYATYDEGQNGKSNSQGARYLARLGTTKPVKHTNPNQWHNEQKGGRISECLKEPSNEQGEDHM